MAQFSQTYTIATTGTAVTNAPGRGYIRVENLEPTGGNPVWYSRKSGVAAVVEGDDMIRIPPGGSYMTHRFTDMRFIAVTAAVKILIDANA